MSSASAARFCKALKSAAHAATPEGALARDEFFARRDLVAQVADGDGLGALAHRPEPRRLVVEERDGVCESGEGFGAEERAVGQLDARLLEREQVAGEVAAVHGRDVLRRERRERLGVVPVEEVAAELLELVEGADGQLQPLDEFERRGVAEVARGDRREQEQADVGRRRAVRDALGVFLKVVGREPVVRLPDELLEEAPRPARDEPRLARVRGVERLALRASGGCSPSARPAARAPTRGGTARRPVAPRGGRRRRARRRRAATATAGHMKRNIADGFLAPPRSACAAVIHSSSRFFETSLR